MSPQRLNLMIISKVKCLDLIYALIELEIIIKDRKNTRNERSRRNDINYIKGI